MLLWGQEEHEMQVSLTSCVMGVSMGLGVSRTMDEDAIGRVADIFHCDVLPRRPGAVNTLPPVPLAPEKISIVRTQSTMRYQTRARLHTPTKAERINDLFSIGEQKFIEFHQHGPISNEPRQGSRGT